MTQDIYFHWLVITVHIIRFTCILTLTWNTVIKWNLYLSTFLVYFTTSSIHSFRVTSNTFSSHIWEGTSSICLCVSGLFHLIKFLLVLSTCAANDSIPFFLVAEYSIVNTFQVCLIQLSFDEYFCIHYLPYYGYCCNKHGLWCFVVFALLCFVPSMLISYHETARSYRPSF